MPHVEVQTMDIDCQTMSFTPLTCHELIDNLTDEQAFRELSVVMGSSQIKNRADTVGHCAMLKSIFSSFVHKSFDQQLRPNRKLIENIACDIASAGLQVERLQSSLVETQAIIDNLTQSSTTTPSAPNLSLLSDNGNAAEAAKPGTCVNSNFCDITNVPYNMLPDSPLSRFNVEQLDNSTEYDTKHNNRETAYYGDYPYKYSGTHRSKFSFETQFCCYQTKNLTLLFQFLTLLFKKSFN